MPCSREGCEDDPRWRPALDLREGPGAAARRLRFRQLGYCGRHKDDVTLPELLSDEGGAKIGRVLREAGKEKIDPRATTLRWEKVDRNHLRRLATRQHRTQPNRGAE